jgi:Tfp pilus assembly protein FimV
MPIGVTAAYTPTRFEGADGEASNGKLDQSKAEATRIAESARRPMSPAMKSAAHRSSFSASGRRQLGRVNQYQQARASVPALRRRTRPGRDPVSSPAITVGILAGQLTYMLFLEPAGLDLGGPVAAQGPARA